MKVLIVANAFPKFSETFIRDHIINLINNGIEVFVLADNIDAKQLDALKGFESYDLMSRTTTLFKLLPKNSMSKLFDCLSLVNSPRMKNVGMTFKKFLSSFFKKGLRKTIYEVKWLDYILKNNIDVVHAHFGNNGEKMAFLSAYGIKLFTTFHGYDIRAGLGRGNSIYNNLIKSKTSVISISDYNQESLISMGFDESRILDLANGIDTDFFKRKDGLDKSDVIKLITIARLSPEKGLEIAVKAIKKIIENNPTLPIEYTIIGEGKSRKDLESLIQDLNLETVVTLVGAKSSLETRNILIKSHLFLLPSLAEALPTVILEAQSSELPILATDVGSVKSMVKGGIVVKPNNTTHFQEGLKELIMNRDKWAEMGNLGRNHVLDNHSINKQTKKLIEFYKTA